MISAWRPRVGPSAERIPRKLLKRARARGVDLTIDRQKWGSGPWDRERDFWDFEHRGLCCKMRRHPRWGHWCGYVAVDRGHPCYGLGYEEAGDILCPGGLTYSDPDNGWVSAPQRPSAPPRWWFGFDCNHAFDLAPGMAVLSREHCLPRLTHGTYKSEAFVRLHVLSLADQLANLGHVGARLMPWRESIGDDPGETIDAETVDPSTRLARRCRIPGCDAKPVNVLAQLCPSHSLRQTSEEMHEKFPEQFPYKPPTLEEWNRSK